MAGAITTPLSDPHRSALQTRAPTERLPTFETGSVSRDFGGGRSVARRRTGGYAIERDRLAWKPDIIVTSLWQCSRQRRES